MAAEQQELLNPQALSKEAAIDFTAGCIGGVACAYTGQPMDTIKVKMQTYPSVYRSSVKCFMDTLKNEGVLRLWAGAVPSAVAQIAENAVLFLAYGQCTKAVAYGFGVKKEEMTTFHSACAGSFAAVFAAFALAPPELIKCRMQTLGEHQGTIRNITPHTIIRDVMRTDGIRGFYHGMIPTLLREVPGYFFFFGGYEGTKTLFETYDTNKIVPTPVRTILAGGVGGVALWTAIYPTDVIKSRMQVYSSGGSKVNFAETCSLIFKEEGVRSFYKGIGPTLLRAFPACAALFLAYEKSKKMMSEGFS